jgi:hypothetical protein
MDIFESGVDLLIGGITPLSKCLYGTVEAELNEGKVLAEKRR